MEGATFQDHGKMGHGVLRYSPLEIVAVVDSEHAGQWLVRPGTTTKVPIVATVDEAQLLGADVLILGIAPGGGLIPAEWQPVLDHSVQIGMSIVNGLHDLLAPRYASLHTNQFVWDIRTEPKGLQPSNGDARYLRNRRVLMIGTDMAVGKMTAGLELLRVAMAKGISASFVATGQIGMTITGRGVPLDAIRVDFAGGSIEREVMSYPDSDLVIVEGQGALIHPGSSANLPLLRGSCPTHLILCLKAGQTHLRNYDDIRIPPLGDYVRMYEDLAEALGTFQRPSTVGVFANTAGMDDVGASAFCQDIEEELSLPCEDPVRHGPNKVLAALMA
jgi:uncharacterized NAD-dependent epimerase/dehydratase family protein